MLRRQDRVVLVLALAAIGLTIAYGVYLAPQWDPSRNDQVQYQALARGLVERGEYTRATGGEPFIPEPLRFPGYPLFIATACIGGCSLWLITIAQGLLLGSLVLMVAAFASPLVGRRGARISAALVALNPAYAFFAAHTLSDLLATVLGFATVVAATRMTSAPRSGIAAGAFAAATALARPLLVFTLPVAAFVVVWRRGLRTVAAALAVATVVFVVAFAPYVAYMERSFARPLAGSTGAQLWLAYFQAQDERALDSFERAQADAGRAALTAFDGITDRVAQAQAFVALDDELRARALSLIGHDPAGFAVRGLARSVQLWAGDAPVRAEDANGAIAVAWLELNLMFFGFGVIGAVLLARRGGPFAAMPLAIIVATWTLSYPLWAEGRFSLPARPFVAIGAAALALRLFRGRRV